MRMLPQSHASPRPSRSKGSQRVWSIPTPRNALFPTMTAAAVLLGWAAVAFESGSVWVEVTGTTMACLIAAGFLLPPIALMRSRIECTRSPMDCVAGTSAPLTLTSSRPLMLSTQAMRSAGKESIPAVPGSSAVLEIVPQHTGVIRTVSVTAASAYPFGLLWWQRKVYVALPQVLCVAPRLGEPFPGIITYEGDHALNRSSRFAPSTIGELRGVIPYLPGHSRRWVHWLASAHSGSLMVREMEDEDAKPIRVVVALPRDEELADALAARALGTLVELLSCHHFVILCSREDNGLRVEPVRTRQEAGRRLATTLKGSHPLGDEEGVIAGGDHLIPSSTPSEQYGLTRIARELALSKPGREVDDRGDANDPGAVWLQQGQEPVLMIG